MSDPALRERRVSLRVGDSSTVDIAEGFIVTRLEDGELTVEELA
jgi:hypothetical protein